MSITAVAWALKLEVGSPTLKFVLIAVANYADDNGRCWPSQERLARDTELTDRCIRESLKKLEEKGFLTRDHRQVHGSKRQSDVIQLVYQRKQVPVGPEERGSGGGGGEERGSGCTTGTSRPKPEERGSGKNRQENHQGEPSKGERADALSPPDAFEQFWDLYPNKVGKPKARTAFEKAVTNRRATFQVIMAGLHVYVVKTDDRPWCNPATWLNQDRWEDSPANVIPHPRRGAGTEGPSLHDYARHFANAFGDDDEPNHSNVYPMLPKACG